MNTVRVTFHSTYPPHVAGDVAGLRRDLAERLRARGVVTFEEERPVIDLDGLDRAGLLALARDRLGLVDEPPADVADADLRAALRAALLGGASGEGAPGWDRLDAMDRAHLEAFAREKVGMQEIDPEMDDAELRRQIRAAAAATLSAGVTAAPEPAVRRRRG